MVGRTGLPCHDFRRDRDSFVRAVKGKASDHGGVTWVSIRKVETVHDFVNECSLGEGDGMCRAIAGAF
jgi:hypothetical protein